MSRKLCIASAWIGLLIVSDVFAYDDESKSPFPPLAAQGTLQSAFAPWDDVEALFISVLDGAKKQVLVQTYLLTSQNIARALIAAHQRGVEVKVLADVGQLSKSGLSKLPELVDAGIAVWLETKYQNAHNKIIVVDPASADATVITGSYNFTWSAQNRNSENILIARQNPPLAAQYLANWERHRQHATPYKK